MNSLKPHVGAAQQYKNLFMKVKWVESGEMKYSRQQKIPKRASLTWTCSGNVAVYKDPSPAPMECPKIQN